MFTVVLVVGLLAGVYCLALGASCLIAALRENDLPDIEDIQVQETAITEARIG